MKKTVFVSAVFAALSAQCLMTSCSRHEEEDEELARLTIRMEKEEQMDSDHRVITFACAGDFDMRTQPFSATRSLEANGRAMTDLWVMDYSDDGTLLQIIHQTSDDDDFGTPAIDMEYGSHTIYFVASRGSGATIDTDAKVITFARVLDTFWQSLALTVTSSSDANRTVNLSRVVTKLTMVFTDAIPEGAAAFNVTPAMWHYGIDYHTGEPTAATASQTITVNIPASYVGNYVESVSIFGFSGTDEWTTDISVDCKTSEGAILGQAEISGAPFKRNRVTSYSGPLFDRTRSMTFTLSDSWLDAYDGTW